MVMHLLSAASATSVAATPVSATPMSASSVTAEAATPGETVTTEPSDAMSDMWPEIVAIVPVAKIPDMMEEAGAAKAEIERTIKRIVSVFGVPIIAIGVAV
jgi:hypothetical protein